MNSSNHLPLRYFLFKYHHLKQKLLCTSLISRPRLRAHLARADHRAARSYSQPPNYRSPTTHTTSRAIHLDSGRSHPANLQQQSSRHRTPLLPHPLPGQLRTRRRNSLHRRPPLRPHLDQRRPSRHLQLRHLRSHRLPRLPRRSRDPPSPRHQHAGYRGHSRPRHHQRTRPRSHPQASQR